MRRHCVCSRFLGSSKVMPCAVVWRDTPLFRLLSSSIFNVQRERGLNEVPLRRGPHSAQYIARKGTVTGMG